MEGTFPEGRAIVYCEGAFGTPYGKTAHGLLRRTRRYELVSVIDSVCAGSDAGEILDRHPCGIPVLSSLQEALEHATASGSPATHLVIGLATDGGRLPSHARSDVAEALRAGLHVDSGLHDFLSENRELQDLAATAGVRIRDVRRPPDRSRLHFFTGEIERAGSFRVAVLGTDSAVGKRTTAWKIVEELESRSRSVEMIGTGQTAWMQGVRFGIILDSLVNDFVSGEIEHAVCSAWNEVGPEFMLLEGQGSLMNPAYPGGFELLAAGRPHAVVLQHAPARIDYDGFPGYRLHDLNTQIQAVELLSGRPVMAVTLNHENMEREEVPAVCARIHEQTGLPCVDVLLDGAGPVADVLERLAADLEGKQ